MRNNKLSVHHVGGRAGSRSFPNLKKFEKDIINVLYDADADCIEQILKTNKSLDSELHVLPYALGDSCKPGVLNINYDPFTSSLLETNNLYDSFSMFSHDHDYIIGETTKTIDKRDVELRSIDDIFSSNSLPFPKPDFLSIDVEGGEYGIIKGASKTMNCNILAIHAEVTFHPFRMGQNNFSELCDLLADHGFYFAMFSNADDKILMQEMSPYRYPIGLRGAGFHTLSDAIFLRKIDYIEDRFPETTRYINLRKLAFIAIAFNQIEYGLECLKRSRLMEYATKYDEFSATNYLQFLSELERIVEIQPQIFPQTFISKYSFEQSKVRVDWNEQTFRNKYKVLLSKTPIILKLSLQIYRIIIRNKNKVVVSAKKFTSGYSKFEKTFIKYGLTTQASIIRKKRISQSKHMCKLNVLEKQEEASE